jgi:hypothetical protein
MTRSAARIPAPEDEQSRMLTSWLVLVLMALFVIVGLVLLALRGA